MTRHAVRPNRTISFLALLAASLALAAGPARAQDPLWDHYKAYLAQPHVTFNAQVILTDQFQVTTHLTQYLDWFANPVEKQHAGVTFPINHPDLHYTWWAINQLPFAKDVVATNQFGDHVIHVGQSAYLLNPALKNAPAGTPLPVANHYKCYECTGDSIGVPLILTDQFYARTAGLLVPRFFCTPVEKTIQGGPTYPIVDPNQHYVVYDIDFGPPIFNAVIRDQFVQDLPVQLNVDRLLMVPTVKSFPTGTESSTWGRLKRLYR